MYNRSAAFNAPLERGRFYHVYNRGNNRENLFVERRNYRFFLDLYRRHIWPIGDTFAYVLLPNHFHVLIRLKQTNELHVSHRARAPSRCFANLFNAYARSYNILYERTGSLFEKPFQRRVVTSSSYFLSLIRYIHLNPQHHGLVDDFRRWPYSSVRAVERHSSRRASHREISGWFEENSGQAEVATPRDSVVVLYERDFL